jgi:hypothetical protein
VLRTIKVKMRIVGGTRARWITGYVTARRLTVV